MPVSSRSRYRDLEIFSATDAAGQSHPTVGIRPSPEPRQGLAPFRHVVTGVETLEYLAWRYYGRSDAWWRIADANPACFPLVLFPGTSLVIPDAGEGGRVVRTRRF
jgi:phage tail protein X